MVSPFRIAMEASADGAEKYLDELLIWASWLMLFVTIIGIGIRCKFTCVGGYYALKACG